MTYYVMVENGAAQHYTATIIGWPNCVADGATREEAITRVKRRFTEQLNHVEIVPVELEIEAQPHHPWTKFAGMYAENPLFDEVLDAIQAYRNEIDADETVL
ncbi:MAG: hypothetical protein R3C14_16440 [Caldilineaceae bacterium]